VIRRSQEGALRNVVDYDDQQHAKPEASPVKVVSQCLSSVSIETPQKHQKNDKTYESNLHKHVQIYWIPRSGKYLIKASENGIRIYAVLLNILSIASQGDTSVSTISAISGVPQNLNHLFQDIKV
jgi:hypothetical protein